VQRTSAPRGCGAATSPGSCSGATSCSSSGGDRLPAGHATQAKEYAEPEWYVDLWLTIVWVAYLLVFLGTLMKRKEPHIYVANWFYLSFIVTVAMLHVVNNLSIPVSLFGSESRYSVFSGVQDAR
jgi:cbb3-type cytochrome oxidase subunit 1